MLFFFCLPFGWEQEQGIRVRSMYTKQEVQDMKFFTGNELVWRLLRTIVQGIIGVVIANLDLIIGTFHIDPAWKTLIVAGCMAVLSPIMAELGNKDEIDVTK